MARAEGKTAASFTAPCPACGGDAGSTLACLACGAVLEEVQGATHFARLALPEAMPLDRDALETRYLRLSRLLHPDFHGAAGEELRERANRNSALLNEARAVLADDQERAEYLLGLRDPQALEHAKSLPPAFLAEAMELSEEAEALRDAGDPAARAAFAARVREEIARRRASVAGPGAWAPQDATALATTLHELRVFARILRDAEARS